MIKKIFTAAIFFCAFGLNAQHISLKECEDAALKNSPDIKALDAQARSAEAAYKGASAGLYPAVNLEAAGTYVTEVPKLSFYGTEFEFGDKWGYSAGPVLYYTLFDYGARNAAAQSAKSVYEARRLDLEWGKKSALLSVRLAYFKVQQDLERMYLLGDQLEVARRQLADIKSAFNAGARNNLDVYMANMQVLSLLSQINSARAATASDLRDLFRLTRDDFNVNPSYPLDARLSGTEGLPAPTALVGTDGVDASLKTFAVYNYFNFDSEGPALAAREKTAEYYQKLSQSYSAALWPKVALKAGAYWQYPNGPIREHVFLGQGSLSLVMPLFEGGASRSKADEQKRAAQAALAQKESTYADLRKTFDDAKDRLVSIETEKTLAAGIIEDSKKRRSLTYSAYNAGTVTFLEVDAADAKVTESRINLTDLKIENLARLAVMASLGK